MVNFEDFFNKYFILRDPVFLFTVVMIIVSVALYAQEPMINVIVNTKVLKQRTRQPQCRNGKITKVFPQKDTTISKHSSQKQNITIEFADKTTKDYEATSHIGYDVNDEVLFDLINNTLELGCNSGENDKVVWDNEMIEKVPKNEASSSVEKTIYYDKHNNVIEKGQEYINAWLCFFCF